MHSSEFILLWLLIADVINVDPHCLCAVANTNLYRGNLFAIIEPIRWHFLIVSAIFNTSDSHLFAIVKFNESTDDKLMKEIELLVDPFLQVMSL